MEFKYCANCGAKMFLASKYCTKCGTPYVEIPDEDEFLNSIDSEESIEKREEEDIAEKIGKAKDPPSIVIDFYGRTLEYNSSVKLYIDSQQIFTYRTKEATEKFDRIYVAKVKDFATLIDEGFQAFIDTSKYLLLAACEFVNRNGGYAEPSDLLEKIPRYNPFISVMEYYMNLGSKLTELVEKMGDRRALLYSSGAHWRGGGFGVVGAISGAVTAGAMNLGLHAIRNLNDSIRERNDIKKLLEIENSIYKEKDHRKLMTDGLRAYGEQLFQISFDFLVDNNSIKGLNFSSFDAIDKFEEAESYYTSVRSNISTDDIEKIINIVSEGLQEDPRIVTKGYEVVYKLPGISKEPIYSTLKIFSFEDEFLKVRTGIINDLKKPILDMEEKTLEDIDKKKAAFERFIDSLNDPNVNLKTDLASIDTSKYKLFSTLPENTVEEIEKKISLIKEVSFSADASNDRQRLDVKLINLKRVIEAEKKAKIQFEEAKALPEVTLEEAQAKLNAMPVFRSIPEISLERMRIEGVIKELKSKEQHRQQLLKLEEMKNHPESSVEEVKLKLEHMSELEEEIEEVSIEMKRLQQHLEHLKKEEHEKEFEEFQRVKKLPEESIADIQNKLSELPPDSVGPMIKLERKRLEDKLELYERNNFCFTEEELELNIEQILFDVYSDEAVQAREVISDLMRKKDIEGVWGLIEGRSPEYARLCSEMPNLAKRTQLVIMPGIIQLLSYYSQMCNEIASDENNKQVQEVLEHIRKRAADGIQIAESLYWELKLRYASETKDEANECIKNVIRLSNQKEPFAMYIRAKLGLGKHFGFLEAEKVTVLFMKAAAKKYHPFAMAKIGSYYREGAFEFPKELDKAIGFLRSAEALFGSTFADEEIKAIMQEIMEPKELSRGNKLINISSIRDNYLSEKAIVEYTEMQQLFVEGSVDRLWEYKDTNPSARFFILQYYWKKTQPAESAEEIKIALEDEALLQERITAGDTFAKAIIASHYCTAEARYGLVQNYVLTICDLANQGEPYAVYSRALYGLEKMFPDLINDNETYSLELLKSAVNLGDPCSFSLLGKYYLYGKHGLPLDFEKARILLSCGKNFFIKEASDELEKLDTRRKSSSGCYITTAVCRSFEKPDDCYELTCFRQFRDGWLSVQPGGKELIEDYYIKAPQIVERIDLRDDSDRIYMDIWNTYLAKCLEHIENHDYLHCKESYVEMVNDLESVYL